MLLPTRVHTICSFTVLVLSSGCLRAANNEAKYSTNIQINDFIQMFEKKLRISNVYFHSFNILQYIVFAKNRLLPGFLYMAIAN